jgi:cytochrome P450
MSDLQLRDEMFTLLLGGHESTALSLGWTLYLLSQHPEVEARLRSEVAQVLGDRQPTLQDLPQLAYTRMVLDESIRLFPPAWVFERRAIADDEIMGYRVPAGMNLGLTPYVTHRLPEFWENPDTFDPEHMRPERMEKRPRFAYMPFGGGPRQCIGNTFALQEMHLILPMLLQRYRFELDPAFPVQREPVVSLRVKGGLRMRLMPVQAA